MRLTTRLRTAPGVWLAPLMVVAFIMVVNDTAGEPYWLAQVAGDAGEPWSSTRCVPWLEPWKVIDSEPLL